MQTTELTVTMVQPLQDAVTRRLFGTTLPDTVSDRQLAGYLTHTLFADAERGGVGTLYHVAVKDRFRNRAFTVQRNAVGQYVHI